MKRALMTKAQRAQFLQDNCRLQTLTFRYTDNAHGNVVKIKDSRGDFIKGVGCRGGGYDMTGTCLGQFIQKMFPDQIKRLDSRDFYGLHHRNMKRRGQAAFQAKASKHTRTTLDGGCGMQAMQNVLNRIGFKLQLVHSSRSSRMDLDVYTLKSI